VTIAYTGRTGDGTGGLTASYSWTHTGAIAGNQFVFALEWNAPTSATISAITVTGATDGTQAASLIGSPRIRATDMALQLAYFSNIITSENKTIAVTFSAACYAGLSSWEYSGGDTTGFYDNGAEAGNDNGAVTPANPATVTFSTNVDHDMIFALVIAQVSDGSWVTPSGYAVRDTVNSGYYLRAYDKVDSGASHGSTTVNVDLSQNDWWCMKAAGFKTAGGAGTAPKTFTGTDSLAGGELL
jgi:hypothetical protein